MADSTRKTRPASKPVPAKAGAPRAGTSKAPVTGTPRSQAGKPGKAKPAPATPMKTASKAPGKTVVKAPVKPKTMAPAKVPAKVVVKTPAKAPAKPPVKTPAKAVTKPPAKTPAKAVVKTPAMPPVKGQAKPPAKAPAKPPAKPPVKGPAKPPVKPTGKGATPPVVKTTPAKAPAVAHAGVPKPSRAITPSPASATSPGKSTAVPIKTKEQPKPTATIPVKTAKPPAGPPPRPMESKSPTAADPAARPAATRPATRPESAPVEIRPPAAAKLPHPPAGVLLRGATFVTLNMVREVVTGDLRVDGGRIVAIGEKLKPRKDEKVMDVQGLTVFPGFIHLHVHLCQTLFRHMAEDMALFDWLRNRIWPLEAAHNQASMAAAARLGILELLLSGTTTVFTMESTHHTDAVLNELILSGMRAFSGKSLMDSGRGVPAELREETSRALDAVRRHLADWHGKGRLQVTVCPRFAPSCSADLLRGAGALAREAGTWIHTHIAETRDEVQLTREIFGRNPVQLYEALGYLEGKFLGVHAVHLTEAEKLHLAGRRGTVLVHCPSTNLKLGSGIAPISDLLSRGIRVGLGADGAACNNNLSLLQEMRLAGLLQKVSRGAAALSADMLLELATIDAAKAIGMDEEIGSIEVGKRADLVFFDLNHPSIQVAGSPAQQLVWSASPRDLVHTMIEGEFLVRDRKVRRLDAEEVMKTARAEARKLVGRAGLEGRVKV